uniref:Retrotransposon gag domain-containing protein n=1 Tax=Lactuca sativa TaxID=4236 RepID=A0A9R1V273_LACSA|nr:hypothetical protein LSAT_V11C700362320 [Lactuca sativa]
MHTRHSERSSPLAFDPEIERTARSNRVVRRNINPMSVDNVVVEDVVEGREDAANNPPPLVPPLAPQLPNNNNGNNNNAGTPIIQPVQPQPNRNNRGQNGGNGGNWAQNMGGNVGNHNGGNVRNQNQNPRNVGPQFGNGGDGVTMNLVGIRTTTVVTGGIKAIGVEMGTTTITGTTRISPMVGTMTTTMDSEIKALGINIEGIQMVDSTMQMEDTTMKPGEYDDASLILFVEGNEHHVEVRPQLISVLPVFRGHKTDDPYNHLYECLAIANANTPRGTNRDSFRLHLFPFTLKEKAKYWFTSLAPHSITTWEQLKTKFLQEFYPASKTMEIRKAIQDFAQKPNEEFHDAFERLKELLRSCPHHEFPCWQLVCFFYDGVDTANQTMINSSSGGTIMMQDSEDAWRFLEQLSHGSKTNYSAKKRDNPVSYAASVGLDKNWKNEVKYDINSLNKKFDLLLSSLGKEKGVFFLQGQKICVSYRDSGHIADECMRSQEGINEVHGYGGTSKKEETDGNKLDKIMEFITQTYQKTNTNSKSIAAIEKQIAQLAEQIRKREDGKFPSTTTVNPSHTQRPGKEHQVNEVITLRSGKKVDNKVSAPTLDNDIDTEVIFDEKEEFEKDSKSEKQKEAKGNDDSKVGELGVEVNTAPYPSDLEKPASFPFGKRGPKMEDMWDLFSQVKINIPLVKLIKEVPSYAKFLKDLCVKKRKLQAHLPKKIDLTEHASSIISNKLPPKLKNPGAPLISVTLGNINIKKALLDLGASVNIIPGNLFDQHDLDTLEQTDIILRLADKSTKIPWGILLDVIIKVEDFYYPVDFLVLDTESTYKESQPSIILGRPFLVTINAQINCRTGAMDISFGNRKLRINIFNTFPNSPSDYECYRMDVVDDLVHHFTPKILHPDPLEFFLSNYRVEVLDLDDIKMRPPWSYHVEKLPTSFSDPLKPSLEEPPTLELKTLPSHLKYSFLGSNENLPIIISYDLTGPQEEALLKVLSKYKGAIGWTIADLKGISPTTCMHRIITEAGAKPSRDA